MATTTLPLGYLRRSGLGSAATWAFHVWLPIHHRNGIGQPVWLVFDAPAGDVTAPLGRAVFVDRRPKGRWERIPADLDGELGAKLQQVVAGKWLEARLGMN